MAEKKFMGIPWWGWVVGGVVVIYMAALPFITAMATLPSLIEGPITTAVKDYHQKHPGASYG